MKIVKLELSNEYMSSNCYLLINDKDCVVIDPGFEDLKLYNYLSEHQLNLTKIIITHGHYDHWSGLEHLLKLYPNTKVYGSSDDSYFFNQNPTTSYKLSLDVDLKNSDELLIFDIPFKIFKTPGHSLGSLSFYYNELLFSGDLIFYNGIGRYDLYGGNYFELMNSIKLLIRNIPKSTTIYSGHGRPTTLEHEMKNNPYFK